MHEIDIEKESQQIIETAIQQNATDIHFLPQKNMTSVYFRVYQHLVKKKELEKTVAIKMISHFKFMAGMDIGEHRRPQNGAMEVKMKDDWYYLRISVIPSSYYESLVIRILPQNETLSLKQLSLFPKITNYLYSLTKRANGLIIITGPTGAGKTTTLYAMLYAIKEREMKNIITLEDPIEKKTDSFIQMEVNERAGINYSEGLKAILRHDPDVIMIGEIRDVETAKMAIRSALTGHLVLTTMHTKNAIGAITRLAEFGIPRHDIEQTLVGVIAQRLVNTICPLCGEKCHPFCPRKKTEKMNAIYEILTEKELTIHFNQQDIIDWNYSLKKQFRKAYSLGFITKQTFERWLGEECV